MTPCERLGYKVGDLFTYIEKEGYYFPVGTELKLEQDDRTTSPLFRGIGTGKVFFLYLDWVEPINLSLENE